MVSNKRARGPGDKELRRRAILAAAAAALDSGSFDDLTMASIARDAGLAKGTLYLYFRTKEGLLLGVLDGELDDWIAELDDALSRIFGLVNPLRVASTLVGTLAGRQRMCRLLVSVNAVLERNLELETALGFKAGLVERFTRLAARVEESLPAFVGPGDGRRLIFPLYALIKGLWPMADPPPMVAALLLRPELAPLAIDFEEELTNAVSALLAGLSANRTRERSER